MLQMKSFLFIVALIALTNFCFSSKLKSKTGADYRVKPPTGAVIDENGSYFLCLEEDNYSAYKNPTRKPWGATDTDVKTTFTRLRFNPWTLKVHTGDYTYADSTGYLGHHKTDKVPLGTAFGCEAPHNADGESVIDLRGTPYAVDDTFRNSGYLSAGSAVVSENGQKVVLRGGGYCGWIAPAAAGSESSAHVGGWHLQLKLLPNNNFRNQLHKDEAGNYYINLDKEKNTSGYKLPTRKPWNANDSDLTVKWSKLRINPDNLQVDTGDYKFTESTGIVSHDQGYFQKVAFGTARGCEAPHNADGTANIDLRGTPFRIKDAHGFTASGYLPAGNIVLSENNQVAVIRGGGYCGWFAAVSGNVGFQGTWASFLELLPEYH